MKKTCNTIVSISLLSLAFACNPGSGNRGSPARFDGGVAPDASVEPASQACEDKAECIDQSTCTAAKCVDGICVFERGDESLDVLTISGPSTSAFLGLQNNFVLTANSDGYQVFDLADSEPTTFTPVCGTDGKTYGHPCHAGCAGVEVERMGGCAGGSCQSSDDCPKGLSCQTGACISRYDSCLCPAPLDIASERRADEDAFDGVYAHDSGWIVTAGRELYFRDAAGESHTRNAADEPRKDYTASDRIYDLISLDNGQVALAVYTKGLEIIDVGSGKLVELAARVDTLGRAQQLALMDETLFVADGLLGLGEIDVSDVSKPVYQDDPLETEGRIRKVKASGQTLLLDEGGIGYGVARYSGLRPERVALVPLRDGLSGIALPDPQTGLVVTDSGKIIAINLSQPSQPKEWLKKELKESVVAVTEDRGRLLIRLESGRVVLARLSCGFDATESLSGEPTTGGAATSVDASGGSSMDEAGGDVESSE